MGQGDPTPRSPNELGLGREASLRISVERSADGFVISEHCLVDAFGKREVGERIMRFEKAVDFEIDCRARFRRGGRKRKPERILPVRGLADPLEKLQPIDHIIGFDRLDRGGRILGRPDIVRDQGEDRPDGVDEAVQLERPMILMKAALEAVAEHGPERLPASDGLD
jgi:hypothetical protein